MYTRILVPVDGSTFSEQLIGPAAVVAKATGAELALLRVVGNAEDYEAARLYVERLAAGAGAKAVCTSATITGLGDSDVIIQAAATSFIHMQTLAVSQASHRRRKSGLPSGAQAVAVAVDSGVSWVIDRWPARRDSNPRPAA